MTTIKVSKSRPFLDVEDTVDENIREQKDKRKRKAMETIGLCRVVCIFGAKNANIGQAVMIKIGRAHV